MLQHRHCSLPRQLVLSLGPVAPDQEHVQSTSPHIHSHAHTHSRTSLPSFVPLTLCLAQSLLSPVPSSYPTCTSLLIPLPSPLSSWLAIYHDKCPPSRVFRYIASTCYWIRIELQFALNSMLDLKEKSGAASSVALLCSSAIILGSVVDQLRTIANALGPRVTARV